MDKTDRLRDYGLAFLLYKQGLSVCGYELIRELFIFIKLILNSYLKANSYEEAEAIVRSWNCEDVSNIIDNRLCYEEWQALTDTSESMLPEENDGNPTIEIFNEDGESIMTNVPKTPQSNQ